MWATAALLASAVALFFLAGTPAMADAVRRAICVVVTLGQGDCGPTVTTAAEHVPPEPCVVEASGRESMIEGSFVATVGGGETWLVEKLSDGQYRVTRGTTGKVGVDVGVGLTIQATVDNNPYGAALAANAGAAATFSEGEVYYADDEDAVGRLLDQHLADVALDNTAGSSGPARWLADQGLGAVGADHELPDSAERYVEGGISLSADAKATLLYAGAAADVGVSQVLGYRIGADGGTTEYLQSTVSGGVGAGTWSGADDGSYQYSQISAQGSVQAVVEVERDADGEVTGVRTRMVAAGEAGATNTIGDEVSGPASSGYVERVSELPIKTEADRELALRYLRGMGIQQVAGLSVPIPITANPIDAVASAVAWSDATRARGYTTEQSFDNDISNNNVQIGGELIGKFGGAGQVNTVDRVSTEASYFDGASWQPWRDCA